MLNRFTNFYNHVFCTPDLKPAFTVGNCNSFLEELSSVSGLVVSLFPHLLARDLPIAAMISFAQSRHTEAYKATESYWRKELPDIIQMPKEEALSVGYECFKSKFSPSERKARGIWYTPKPITGYMARGVAEAYLTTFGKTIGDIEGRILEPAAGIGCFVTAVMEVMGEKISDRYDDGTFTAYEIDPIACLLCRLNVTNFYWEKTRQFKPFRCIYCINTLENE